MQENYYFKKKFSGYLAHIFHFFTFFFFLHQQNLFSIQNFIFVQNNIF